MAFFKKQQQAVNKKWYPRSVLVGKPVSTDQLAKRLAAESTVAPADVRAVLTALSGVMGDYMAQGRSVKLDGIGSFYFTAASNGNGVDTAEEVSVNQINGHKVRFIPETTYRRGGTRGRVAVRGLVDVDVDWVDVDTIGLSASAEKPEPDEEEGGGGTGGGTAEDQP